MVSDYFSKWGWYATLNELAGNDYMKMKAMSKENVHEIHLFLAHHIDNMKTKNKVHQNQNMTEL